MTKSLSSLSRPWQSRRTSCAKSAAPKTCRWCRARRESTRCSSGGSCANCPLRRSGTNTAHGHAGLGTVRRGRSQQAVFEIRLVARRIRAPSIVYSGFCTSDANGALLSSGRRQSEKNPGSSLKVRHADAPRGSLTSSSGTAGDLRGLHARGADIVVAGPNARNCMNSRRFDICGLPSLSRALLGDVRRLRTAPRRCSLRRRRVRVTCSRVCHIQKL